MNFFHGDFCDIFERDVRHVSQQIPEKKPFLVSYPQKSWENFGLKILSLHNFFLFVFTVYI